MQHPKPKGQEQWTVTQSYEARILRVMDRIHADPTGDLSLDALADVAALSRFHFHRVFRAVTGETAAQAVRRVRMNTASHLLVSSQEPFASVARRVGYPSVASFARTFRESFGVTPLAFRNRGELRPFFRNPTPEITLMYPVEIRSEPARHLYAMPHRGPYFEINHAFGKLSAVMASRDLFGNAGQMVGVFYDDPMSVPAADLRSHAGFVANGKTEMAPPLESVELQAGRQAVLTYRGPYAGLPAAYDQLYSLWLPKSGEEPASDPAFEIYLNSPMDTAPEDLITELHLPLK
jgi:AraC family transcriptional regulator